MAFLSQSSVIRLYKSVIDETIASSREAFLDEGVDEQVLIELKTLWENKVTSSKAVQITPPPEQNETGASTSTTRKSQPVKRNNTEPPSAPVASNNVFQQNSQQQQAGPSQPQTVTNGTSVVVPGTAPPQQAPAPPPQTMYSSMLDPTKVVPIQITLPPQSGMQEATGRVLTIQVPATALIGNQLQQVLTGPVISATMRLPQQQASNLLQQHVNAALQGQQNTSILAKAIPQVDGSNSIVSHNDDESDTESGEENNDQQDLIIEFPDIFALARALNSCHPASSSKQLLEKRKRKSRKQIISTDTIVPQTDGQNFEHGLLEDSSEDEDDVSDEPSEDEEVDEDKEDEDPDIDGGGMEEEPLNSEDDVSEEDPTDLFDTENVVVCQYDKINRSRNKWKFYLKDGIMNLDGKDFIFQKITGDAEW